MPVAVFVKTVDTIQKAQIAIDACQSSTDHVAKAGTKSMFANVCTQNYKLIKMYNSFYVLFFSMRL